MRETAPPTDEQRALLAKLASIAEMIEGHEATVYMLKRERMQLQHRLRLAGFASPAPGADSP